MDKEETVGEGEGPPPFEAWAQEKIRECEMSCLTGNVAAALIRLGYASDDRGRRTLKWLAKVQKADGKRILESIPSGRMQINPEQKGNPSKFVTLNALRVIKRLYKDRE